MFDLFADLAPKQYRSWCMPRGKRGRRGAGPPFSPQIPRPYLSTWRMPYFVQAPRMRSCALGCGSRHSSAAHRPCIIYTNRPGSRECSTWEHPIAWDRSDDRVPTQVERETKNLAPISDLRSTSNSTPGPFPGTKARRISRCRAVAAIQHTHIIWQG